MYCNFIVSNYIKISTVVDNVNITDLDKVSNYIKISTVVDKLIIFHLPFVSNYIKISTVVDWCSRFSKNCGFKLH